MKHFRKSTVVLGKKGTGKTTLAIDIVNRLVEKYPNQKVVVFDPKGQIAKITKVYYSYRVCDSLGEFLDRGPIIRQINYKYKSKLKRIDKLILSKLDWYNLFNGNVRLLYEYFPKNTIFLIDEVELLAGTGKIDPIISEIMNRGRHNNYTIIMTSHRYATTAKDVTDLSDYVVLFRLSGYRDLQTIKNWIDDQTAEKVKKLPNYKYIELEV